MSQKRLEPQFSSERAAAGHRRGHRVVELQPWLGEGLLEDESRC